MKKISLVLVILFILTGCFFEDSETRRKKELLANPMTVETIKENDAVKVKFSRFPKDMVDISTINRNGEDGKYVTAALFVAALKNWNAKETNERCVEMLTYLMKSYDMDDQMFVNMETVLKDRLMENNLHLFLVNSYFDGTSVDNGYAVDENNLSITLRDSDRPREDMRLENKVLKLEFIEIQSSGADMPRLIPVYLDSYDNKWYVSPDGLNDIFQQIEIPH